MDETGAERTPDDLERHPERTPIEQPNQRRSQISISRKRSGISRRHEDKSGEFWEGSCRQCNYNSGNECEYQTYGD